MVGKGKEGGERDGRGRGRGREERRGRGREERRGREGRRKVRLQC